MSDSRRTALRTYLLQAAFVALIAAPGLPLLQAIAPAAMAEAGFQSASLAVLTVAGGFLGGGIYTAVRWIERLAVREGWARMSPLERRMRRMDRRLSCFLALMISLICFVPIYLIALVQYGRTYR